MEEQVLLKPSGVVEKLFQEFENRNFDGVKELLDANVEWVVSGDSQIMPWAGVFKGPDEVLKLMSNNSGSTQNLQITTKWVVSDSSRVIMMINEQATVSDTGEFYEVDSVHIYTVENGKVVRFENHFDPIPVLRATYGQLSFEKPSPQNQSNLLSEEWIFFDSEGEFHHREEFKYEYDERGQKVKGLLINHGRNITYNMYYQYNDQGVEIGQRWENSADAEDVYSLTNEIDASTRLVKKGNGIGTELEWEYLYEYDRQGRKVRMSNVYSNNNRWDFLFSYDDKGNLVLGKGEASSGLNCSIFYNY